MKKVLLLGDSIRMGYADYVKELLEGKCEVIYDEADNGRFAAYTLWQLVQAFCHHGHFDLVHWNNGYWDMNIEPPMETALFNIEEYCYLLRKIAREIKKQGAKAVFALTTPILEPGTAADNTNTGALDISYNDKWVQKYNEAAKMIMDEEGVPINDLYTLCKEDERYYKCFDMLHLTEEGYRRCAEQIAKTILKELEIE